MLIVGDSGRYGRVEVRAGHRLHQAFPRRGYVAPNRYLADRPLPTVPGTVIEVRVDKLPEGRRPHRRLWLWHTGPTAADLDLCWRAYLRRFDQEHTYRFAKSALGWTAARVRTPGQAERGTWLILAAPPSCAWPATSPATCAAPGNADRHQAQASARTASAADLLTSAATSAPRPVCRNPLDPAPADPKAPRPARRGNTRSVRKIKKRTAGSTSKIDSQVKPQGQSGFEIFPEPDEAVLTLQAGDTPSLTLLRRLRRQVAVAAARCT